MKAVKTDLFSQLSELIEQSNRQVNVQTNSTLTILFWQVGTHIIQDILQNKKATYGKEVVATLALQLTEK